MSTRTAGLKSSWAFALNNSAISVNACFVFCNFFDADVLEIFKCLPFKEDPGSLRIILNPKESNLWMP